MSGITLFFAASSQVVDVHRGAVLPAARFVVIAVPCLAALFYFAVVRKNRGR